MPNVEIAWAAGFFDGEGCCYTRKGGRYLCVTISQMDRRPLDRFVAALGLGKVNGPYGKNGYAVYLVGKKATAAVDALWPHLSEPKREQIAAKKEEVTCWNS